MNFLGKFKVYEDRKVTDSIQAYPQQFLAKVWFGKSKLLWWRGEVTLQMDGGANVKKAMIHDFLAGPGWDDEIKREFYFEGNEHGDPLYATRHRHDGGFRGGTETGKTFELHVLADDNAAYTLYVQIEGVGGRQVVFKVVQAPLEFKVFERIGEVRYNPEALKRIQITA